MTMLRIFFFFSSRRRHTRWPRDWSSDVCSSDLVTRLISGRLADRDVREIHRAVRRLRGTLGEKPVAEQPLERGARRHDGWILCEQDIGSEDDEHSHDTNPAPQRDHVASGVWSTMLMNRGRGAGVPILKDGPDNTQRGCVMCFSIALHRAHA